ncbi:MAG TPA: hypothetical protein VMY43_10205 [Methanothrix sp.]|nr:hypothetical protein [Methanothrix sp.]
MRSNPQSGGLQSELVLWQTRVAWSGKRSTRQSLPRFLELCQAKTGTMDPIARRHWPGSVSRPLAP